MPEERTFVQCSKCGRGVWSTDVNTTGRCVDCAGVASEPQPKKPDEPRESDKA